MADRGGPSGSSGICVPLSLGRLFPVTSLWRLARGLAAWHRAGPEIQRYLEFVSPGNTLPEAGRWGYESLVSYLQVRKTQGVT